MGVVWQKWAWSPKIFRCTPRTLFLRTPLLKFLDPPLNQETHSACETAWERCVGVPDRCKQHGLSFKKALGSCMGPFLFPLCTNGLTNSCLSKFFCIEGCCDVDVWLLAESHKLINMWMSHTLAILYRKYIFWSIPVSNDILICQTANSSS